MMATGTPSPAMNARAPPLMMTSTLAVSVSGWAVSRSTPNGLSVRSFTRAIWSAMNFGGSPAMPSEPKPPASLTAAQTSA